MLERGSPAGTEVAGVSFGYSVPMRNKTSKEVFGMGTHYVHHTCGHRVRHVLTVAEEKQGKVEWLESVVCPECFRAEKEKEKAAARQKADAEAQKLTSEAGFPALTGSEKQVKWANTIRAELWKLLGDADEPDPADQETLEALEKIRKRFFAETSAKWWIDHRGRYRCIAEFADTFMKGLPDGLWEL